MSSAQSIGVGSQQGGRQLLSSIIPSTHTPVGHQKSHLGSRPPPATCHLEDAPCSGRLHRACPPCTQQFSPLQKAATHSGTEEVGIYLGTNSACTRRHFHFLRFGSHFRGCQGSARAKWLAVRSAELLPVPYFHVVFTLPHSLSALVLQNKRRLYDPLYCTSAATKLELARDPKRLGADIGFLGVLHTWGPNLEHHPLHRSRRRPGSRRFQMDRFLATLLPAGSRAKPRLPRQVRRWTEAARLRGQASVSRLTTASARSRLLPRFSPAGVSTGLGRLRQAAVRRRRTCSQLPGRPHSSRLFRLARLCPWREEEDHDSLRS